MILASGWARVFRATPLWLSRSCNSVRLGISTCEQLETVVPWQTAELIERPVCHAAVLVCTCRPSSTLAAVLRRSSASGLVEHVLYPGSCCAQQCDRPVGAREQQTVWVGFVSRPEPVTGYVSLSAAKLLAAFPAGVLLILVLDSLCRGDLRDLFLLSSTRTLVVGCWTDVGCKAL